MVKNVEKQDDIEVQIGYYGVIRRKRKTQKQIHLLVHLENIYVSRFGHRKTSVVILPAAVTLDSVKPNRETCDKSSL